MASHRIRKTSVFIALCLTGCSCHHATRLDIKPETLTPHCVGEYSALAATVYDQHGEPMPGAAVTFTSSNPEVALVDASGIVTPRKSGTAEITAKSGKASAAVQVKAQLATRLHTTSELVLYGIGGGSGSGAIAVDDSGHEVAEAPLKVVSSDPTKLAVERRNVISRALGETSVKVSCGSLSATIPVHIVLPPFGGIVIEDKGPLELTSGTSQTLQFHELRADGKTPAFDIPLEITSSDPKVLTVDNHGLMTGVAPGTATVRLHAGAYSATIDVTVVPSG